jgi:ABC-2 type transport system ATP-binding protein
VAAAIDVRGLNKSFGDKHVVRDVSIAVEEGHVTGFLGPNGSGKTTTMRMLCGLLTPDSGEGTCLGLDILRRSREGSRSTRTSPSRRTCSSSRVYGMDDRARRVTEALAKLGLESRRRQAAGSLSGGWKQRLALAAAVLHEPRLLLLDEPTAGVDPKARREFWDEIHALAAGGLTVMVSTHYMDEAERCHDIAYIAYGRLMARGTVEELIEDSGLVTFLGEGPGADRLAGACAKARRRDGGALRRGDPRQRAGSRRA